MTTVAYKSGLLAFDSRITQDTLSVGHGVKGRITKDYMIAAAGECQDIAAFFDWVEAGMTITDRPKFGLNDREVEVEALMVTKKGKIYCFDNRIYPFEIDAPFYALGSGGQLAMGAMACGASAFKAVKIASQYDTATGGEIKVLAIKKREKKRKDGNSVRTKRR